MHALFKIKTIIYSPLAGLYKMISWYKFEVTILLHCPNWSLITVSFQSQVEIWELKIKRQCSPGKGQVLSCAGEGRA